MDFFDLYMNRMQLLASIIDPNKLFVEAGRATGKTEGIIGPRTVRVAASMPRETSAFAHKTYMALFSNIIPNLIAYYQTSKTPTGEPMLQEGKDFVIGEKDLPKHFIPPRYPLIHPEHTIVFANGHNIRLVASDQAESIAGSNIVHGFIEEMKHNSGEKLRTRLFPAFRVGRLSQGADQTTASPYYAGITGVSDTARISLKEDDWFTQYEKKVNPQLIEDIITLSLHVEKAKYNVLTGKNVPQNRKILAKFQPHLDKMRSIAIYYIRVSTLVNKEVLGKKFFETQLETLPMDELLTSIFSIRERSMENSFFPLLDEEKHFFDDSYTYKSILSLNLKDSFTLDSGYLKHYNPKEKLLLGYDPGSFASLVVAQEKKTENTLRVLKEIFVFSPEDIPDLARKFAQFFSTKSNRLIELYYDRAGNKKEKKLANETAAKELKAEIEKYGFKVQLMNLGQRTIYHWEHYRLWQRLLANQERSCPRILIDSNECPYLKSALFSCKKVKGAEGPVELDKSTEKKLPLNMQAGLSPQIPSALMYLVFGKYSKWLPGKDFVAFSGGLQTNLSF